MSYGDEDVIVFRKMSAIVCSDGTKSKMYDEVWQPIGEEVDRDDVAFVCLDGKIGFIDYYFKEICPPKYDEVISFYNGYACVKLNGKYGFVDKSGNEICEIKYDKVWAFSKNGVAVVSIGEKYGFINTNGEEVCPVKYKIVGYQDGSSVRTGYNIFQGGSSDITGIDIFHEFWRFNDEGLAIIIDSGKYGLVDSNGQIVVEPQYDDIDLPNAFCKEDEKYIPYTINGKAGFLDCNGNVVMNADFYDEVRPFVNGLACVTLGDKSGIINSEFEPTCDLEYDRVDPLWSEGAVATKISKMGPLQITLSCYINSDGVLDYIYRREIRIGPFCFTLKF